MKKKILFTGLILLAISAQAQVARRNIVEHFTNTNCGICAGANPNVFSAIAANAGTLHISFHPSSPYASCVISMSNPVENDGRTNFYNIYGGTPRIVANGVSTSVSALNTTLGNLANGTTNFDVQATQTLVGTDSVSVTVQITKVAADTSTTAILFAGAKQDTLNQLTGNGESVHRNVFRKALTNIVGNTVTLPSAVGASTDYTFGYKIASSWPLTRMQTIAILQTSTKQLIQAAESNKLAPGVPTSVNTLQNKSSAVIYPNPAHNEIIIADHHKYNNVRITDINGKQMLHAPLNNASINIGTLPVGVYHVQLISERGIYTSLINKK